MKIHDKLNKILIAAYSDAKLRKNKYITPEHILSSIISFEDGIHFAKGCGFDVKVLKEELGEYIDTEVESGYEGEPIQTFGTNEMFNAAATQVMSSDRGEMKIKDIFIAIFDLENSYASYYLKKQNITRVDILKTDTKETKKELKVKDDAKGVLEEKSELLQKYAVCLNDKYQQGKIAKIIGRNEEIRKTVQILLRKKKNNPIHVGESGVGKTSIVYGIVQNIEEGSINSEFAGTKVYSLDMGTMLAGTKYRGDFEERLQNVLKEIAKEHNPIVYIDDIHTVIGAGSISGGSLDATSLLSRYLEEGEIKFIGSTTYSEFNKHISKNATLSRRFQKIDINEPCKDENLKILKGVKGEYEEFHSVEYTEQSIEAIVDLAQRHMRDRKFPDKAIDLMDEIGARTRMDLLEKEISDGENRILIDEHDTKKMVADIIGVPHESIEKNQIEKLKNLKNTLEEKVFGQEEAISSVVGAIKRSYAGLNDDKKPVGSFLFVGPTGVGKTELAKQVASTLDMSFQRFDMSEYGEKHSVARLIGAPPGYVGYDEGGLLTDKIRNTPRCVVLLDEIEKAHGDIYNILLQVMDYGTLTDNSGIETDFRNTIIIMTSNAGAKDMGKDRIGFGERTLVEDAINDELTRVFMPEFLNRLDDTIIFKHLGEKEVEKIISRIFHDINERIKKGNREISVGDDVVRYVIQKSYSKKYGAREIFRFIDKNIKGKLVDRILFRDGEENEKINISVKDGEIFLS